MTNTSGSQEATGGARRAKLVGYVNPLGLVPAFVIPVFRRGGDEVLQEADEGEKIRGFYPFEEAELGKLVGLNLDTYAEEGGEILYGFAFPDGACVVEPRRALAKRLRAERAALSGYHFLYMEVLNFLNRYDDLKVAINKVSRAFADNPLISKRWAKAEKTFVVEKKTLPAESSYALVQRALARQPKERGKRAERVGVVSSDKMMKTVVVRVDRLVRHPKYRRYVRRTSKFMAHDELGAVVGDKVRIVETRPISAHKRWRVVEIVKRASK
jgi:small subunit ribosomal protein S17